MGGGGRGRRDRRGRGARGRLPPLRGHGSGRPRHLDGAGRRTGRLVPRSRWQRPVAESALLDWKSNPAARRSRSLRVPERGRPVAPNMPLSTLLQPALDDPAAAALARDGGRAFVASAMRPYLIAALAEADANAPVLVVAADDR